MDGVIRGYPMRTGLFAPVVLFAIVGCNTPFALEAPTQDGEGPAQTVPDPCEVLVRDFGAVSRAARVVAIEEFRASGLSERDALSATNRECRESCAVFECLVHCIDCSEEIVTEVYVRRPSPPPDVGEEGPSPPPQEEPAPPPAEEPPPQPPIEPPIIEPPPEPEPPPFIAGDVFSFMDLGETEMFLVIYRGRKGDILRATEDGVRAQQAYFALRAVVSSAVADAECALRCEAIELTREAVWFALETLAARRGFPFELSGTELLEVEQWNSEETGSLPVPAACSDGRCLDYSYSYRGPRWNPATSRWEASG